jgi:DNA-binding GntR family transcriptional regulator
MIEKIHIERNLQNRVYEIIKNYLMRPDVPPGTHLFEDKLAKEIGVSRTPVKLALNRLQQEGLVVIQPNRGAFKVYLNFQDVIEIVKIRIALECLSLEIGADNNKNRVAGILEQLIPNIESFQSSEDLTNYPELDRQFHENLIKAANSQWLLRMIKDHDSLFHMFRLLCLQNIERISSSIEEHKKIVEALKRGEIFLTTSLIREHWESAIKDLEKKHREIPGLFL